MRGERLALRAGEYLVSQACRRLPAGIREERHQEWLAELPVILHGRGTGPAPLREVRMLAFAVDTLRGTILAGGAYRYHGAHEGGDGQVISLLAAVLLVLGGPLVLLAYEGYIVYELINGPNLIFSATLVLVYLALFVASCIPRWDSAPSRWYSISKVEAGVGLLVWAIASRSGWGHPLLFSMIRYSGYTISVACMGVAVVLLVRSFSEPRSLGGNSVAS
jgi:hypothetical protein